MNITVFSAGKIDRLPPDPSIPFAFSVNCKLGISEIFKIYIRLLIDGVGYIIN